MTRGKFITLEGIDGAGKSSHLEFLCAQVRAHGCEAVLTREPGGTPVGEAVRSLVLDRAMHARTEALLMFGARAEHVAAVIEPALAAGRWIVCDRFSDATYAYQCGAAACRAISWWASSAWCIRACSPTPRSSSTSIPRSPSSASAPRPARPTG